MKRIELANHGGEGSKPPGNGEEWRVTYRIALVSCVKSKQTGPTPARELYISPLFRLMRAYAEEKAGRWFILSAKYGLVDPDDVIEPYELTLNRLRKPERLKWAVEVGAALLSRLPPRAEILVLAGSRYREYLVPMLRGAGYRVTIPLEGLQLGMQLRYLKGACADSKTTDLNRFYALLADLGRLSGQGALLGECTGRQAWPPRGVYFFHETGEEKVLGPSLSPRITRVGTHGVSSGSRATLWQRLRTHKGQKDGGGNHRGSIFRLHLGAALLNREGRNLESWGKGSSAPREVRIGERDHEQRVSDYIGRMSLLWLDVPGEPGPQSLRSYIERNSIALLSNQLQPADPPSAGWLGWYSNREAIRRSGLWNVNYVEDDYDPQFLRTLEELIQTMASRYR